MMIGNHSLTKIQNNWHQKKEEGKLMAIFSKQNHFVLITTVAVVKVKLTEGTAGKRSTILVS